MKVINQLCFDFTPAHLRLSPEALVKQYEPMIHKLVWGIVFNASQSEVCMDVEDVIQYGRQLVLEARREFNPNKGAKLSTFIHLKLQTKLFNLARKIKTRRKHKTMTFSELGFEPDSDFLETHESNQTDDIVCPFDGLSKSFIDEVCLSLEPTQITIMEKYFIDKCTIREIKKTVLPNMSFKDVKSIIEDLRQYLCTRYNEYQINEV